MALAPIFIGTPKSPTVQLSQANTGRDGTGALVTVYTAGANGARVDRLNITATGTTTGGMIRLFLFDGASNSMIQELPVVPVTPSATQPAFTADIVFEQGLVLQAAYLLKASTHNAETFNATVTNGGDF